MNKNKGILLFVLTIVLFITSCRYNQEYTDTFFTMDTPMTVTAYGRNSKEAVIKSVSYINKLDGLFSKTLNQSEISMANNRKGSAHTFSSTVFTLIEKSVEYSENTDGAFDITLGRLADLWDVKAENPEIPAKSDIEEALKNTGYKNIIANQNFVVFKNSCTLDMGGIVKGYAADGVNKIFDDYGIKSGIINLGGNVYAKGKKSDGTFWKIGIRDPRSDNENDIIGYIEAKDTAVVTSGDYQRYFEKDNIRYHHIIDPKTGYPAKSDLMSATIMCSSSTMADAYSTAVFVMGREKGADFCKKQGIDYILITKEKEILVSDNIKKSFTFEGKEKGYVYEN